jgi:hypothetical protein
VTSTLEWPAPTSVKPRQWPRRLLSRWRLIVALVLALALVGAGSGWLVYAHTYQPWEPGNEGYAEGHLIAGVTDGLRETGLIVTAPKGRTGWIGMSLSLGGSHDVTLLGPPADWGFQEVSLKWQAGDDMAASPTTSATDRPLVVHPGQVVTVWIFVKRPDCSPGGSTYMTLLELRWKALGVHHTLATPISAVSDPTPLYLCYPDRALKHLYQGGAG